MSVEQDHLDEMFGAATRKVEGKDLRSISDLVKQDEDMENEIAALENALAELNERRLKLLTETIPEAMAQAGTSLFVTEDGLKVEVKDHVSGSLASLEKSAEKRAAQLEYIAKNDGASIITADVVAKFGRTNRAAALEAAKSFEGRDDCVVVVKEDVNHMTLKAWGRERLAADPKFDPQQAGLWASKMAMIKRPKKTA